MVVATTRPSGALEKIRVVACDVGQGSATLVSAGSFQVLIDGGPGKKVIDCLGEHMPFWDRRIEVVILTHPHADHYEGLIETFRRYQIGRLVATEDDNSAAGYQTFKSLVANLDIELVFARAGMRMVNGSLVMEFLSPPGNLYAREIVGDSYQNVLGSFTPAHVHDYNVVVHMVYGNFSAMFTGDIEPPGIARMKSRLSIPDVIYMDAPHHGSRNGMTEEFLTAASPEILVISASEDNRYGHPHPEIIDMLERHGVFTLKTYDTGHVVVESDGVAWWYNTQKPL